MVISALNSARYFCFESIALRLARAKHAKEYAVKDDNPLVSVYIPTYNRGELLMERSVSSVLSQTYKNFELIVLGDHCTDNTEELVAGVKDPRVRFYNLPKRGYRYPPTAENHWLAGPVVAANKALTMVKGKWVARLDDDDIWTPDHLEALLRFAQQGDYEFVSARHIVEKNGQRRVADDDRAQSSYYNKINKPIRGDNPMIGGSCTWFYRSYLKFIKYNINCWRKSWNRVNDVELSMRIFSAGARMGFLEKVLAMYLPRPGEQAVGLEAYKCSEEEKLKHFEFKE